MKNIKSIKIFKAFYKGDVGIWYYIPNNRLKFKKNNPSFGFGCVKYAEGSIYQGDLYYDGKNFNKLGFGKQDFSKSSIGLIDTNINEKMSIYVGKFNYKNGDWIYGNGVLYYVDKDNNPTHFVKGFFKGLDKKKDYVGNFDYSKLLDGYTKEMEFNYSPREELFKRELLKMNELPKIENLFLGDSYIEFWNYKEFAQESVFDKVFKNNCLNVGLGGTTYGDWIYFLEKIKDYPLNPKVIIVDLGFNDLHGGRTPLQTLKDFIKFNNLLKSIYKNSTVYYTIPIHTPTFFASYYKEEEQFRNLFMNYCDKNKINYLDVFASFYKLEKTLSLLEYKKYFYKDELHINSLGYSIFISYIKDKLHDSI